MEQNKEISIEKLTSLINKFDLGYEMSEDNETFTVGTLRKRLIKEHISNLNILTIEDLPGLDNTGKTNYKRYFTN